MTRDALKLAEAIAMGLLMLPACWIIRAGLIRFDDPVTGLGETGVPWRWVACAVALLFCLAAAMVPRAHRRVALTIALTGAGLVFGLGINGAHWSLAPGAVWDIRVLWLYMTDSLTTGSARYDTWVSIAWLSALGLVTALAGAIMSFSWLELPLRELRTPRQHGGTNRYRSKETVFGDAQWATWHDIRETVGDPGGIVLGEDYDPRKNPKAYDPGDRRTWGEGGKAELVTLSTEFAGGHSLVFAGTGSGKTAGIVFPTAFTYRHPIIFMDPQHEIFEAVSVARAKMGFQARVIDIGNGVDLIRLLRPMLHKSSIAYMHLADSLVGKADAMKSEYSQFYATEGANLLSGLLEYYATTATDQVFKTLYKALAQPEAGFKAMIGDMAGRGAASEAARTRLMSYAEMDSKNFSNLQSNLKQALNWASFPELCDMLDRESQYAPDLLADTTDVYIRLKIDNLKSFPGMVRAILGAIVYHVNESQDGVERLMIVDEAYQVGRLNGFELIRDTMRKRGLHLMLIFQSTGLLEDAYGKESVRAWNNSVAARVFAATDDDKDQMVISKMIGEYTVDVENRSSSLGMRGFGIGTPTENRSKSVNLQKASLMRPEQVRELQEDGLIVFYKGKKPMICGKALSFRRDEWQDFTPFNPDKVKKSGYGDTEPGMLDRLTGIRGKPDPDEQKPSLSQRATPNTPNPRPREKS